MTGDGVCSQVPDSGKEWKVLNEETALLGAARESPKSHLKRGVHREESTLEGSPSSKQRAGEQSEGKPKSLPSPGAREECRSELESAGGDVD